MMLARQFSQSAFWEGKCAPRRGIFDPAASRGKGETFGRLSAGSKTLAEQRQS
jgi:hypothetical protein